MIQNPPVAPNLPDEIVQAATVSQMGPFTGLYKPRISSPLAIVGIVAGTIIADIILLVLVLLLTGYIFYALVLIPIVAIIYGIYALLHYKVRIYTFAQGLIYAKSEKIDIARWDQVAAVWQVQRRQRYGYSYGGIIAALIFRSNMRESYKLQRNDGITISIASASVSNIQELGQVIQYEITQRQSPQAIAAFNTGQPIPFGPFTVSQQGIARANGGQLPWNQVALVDTQRGSLIIKQTGKTLNWAASPVGKIPNLGVFNAVVYHARSNAR